MQVPVVVFFSFILIFSLYSNILNYANAQIIAIDDFQNDKRTIYGILLRPPPVVTKCDNTDGIPDFGFYGYTSYFGIPSATRDQALIKDGQSIKDLAQTKIYVVGPPTDIDNDDTVLISPNDRGTKNLSPETKYTLIFDQCEDGFFDPKINGVGDGDGFADRERDFYITSVKGSHDPYVFWRLKDVAEEKANGFFLAEYKNAIDRGTQILSWLAAISTISGLLLLLINPSVGIPVLIFSAITSWKNMVSYTKV